MIKNNRIYSRILALLVLTLLLSSMLGTQVLAVVNLTKVTSLRVTSTTSSAVTLSWGRVTGATRYSVVCNGQTIRSSSTTSRISGLKAGTTYTAKVRAENGSKSGPYASVSFKTSGSSSSSSNKGSSSSSNKGSSSNTNTGTINLPKPSTFKAVAQSTMVTFTWTPVAGATGYEIRFSNGKTFNAGTTPLFTVTGLNPGTKYTVQIRAKNGNKVSSSYASTTFTTKTSSNSNNNTGSNSNTSSTTLAKVSVSSKSVTDTTITLKWQAVSGATGYTVVLITPGEGLRPVGTTASTSMTIPNLKPGIAYKVKVQAYKNQNGQTITGPYSNEILCTTSGSSSTSTTIGKVTGLKVSNVTDSTATLSWNKVDGAVGYEIAMKFPGKTSYTSIGAVNGTSTPIQGFTAGATYTTKVRAYKTVNGQKVYGEYSNVAIIMTKSSSNSNTNSNSNTSSTTLAKVSVSSKSVTDTTITLKWQAVSGATGYIVVLITPGEGLIPIGTTASTSMTIPNLKPGIAYKVKVQAYKNQNGQTITGPYSNEIACTTSGSSSSSSSTSTTIGKVTGLKVSNATGSTATLSWNKVNGAVGYEIAMKFPGKTSYTSIGAVNGTSTPIQGFTAGATYTTKVRAYKTVNGKKVYGEYSDETKITTSNKSSTSTTTTKPGRPTLNNATVNGSTINLSWSSVSGVTGYEVYLYLPGIGYSTVKRISGTNTQITQLYAGDYRVKIRAYKTVNGQTIYGDYSNEKVFTVSTKQNTNTNNNTNTNTNNNKNNNTNNNTNKNTNTSTEKPKAVSMNMPTNKTETSVTLNWNSVSNVTAYEVSVYYPGEGYRNVGNTVATSKKVTGLKSGNTYKARVRAYRIVNGKAIYGDYSNVVTFSPALSSNLSSNKVGKVTYLHKISSNTTSAVFSWDKMSGVTGYEVYLYTPGIGYSKYKRISTPSIRINNVVMGKNYKVKVRAYKIANGKTYYGDFSNEVSFTIPW